LFYFVKLFKLNHLTMNIVVTGATKGMGKAIALLFAKHGFNVAACARTQADLDTLKGELIALHPSATIITTGLRRFKKGTGITICSNL
jgi:short-subunit dehydrogenase